MRGDEEDTFLTDKQIEILRMKKGGKSQADIAREKRTTRGNICTIEKTALKNVEKARNTIRFYKAIEAPVWLTIPMGTDLYAVPPNLFKAADQKHIKISIDGVMIVVKLKTQVPDKIRGRLVTDEIDVSVDKNGNLTVA